MLEDTRSNRKQRIRALIRDNPEYFHDVALRAPPLWWKQKEILWTVKNHKKVTCKASYNVGKTFVAATVGLHFLYSADEGEDQDRILITTAPTLRQVRYLLWGEIRRRFIGARMPLPGELKLMEIKITDKWYAIGFSSDDPMNISGFHGKKVMVIMDEASGMDDEIMDQFDGILSGENCWLFMIGNPLRASGRFYEAFKDPTFKHITIKASDHPNVKERRTVIPGMISHEWVEDKERRWGKESPLYKAKVDAEFPENTTDYIVQLAWAEKAKTNELAATGPIEAGLDIADEGGDECVFFVRQGPKVLGMETWDFLNPMETAGRAIQLCRKWGVHTLRPDPIGVGAGVSSRLKEVWKSDKFCVQIVDCNAAENAANLEEFHLVRDEMGYGLSDRFRDGQIDCSALDPNDEFFTQVCNVKKGKITSKGQLTIEPKKEMKGRGFSSPDRYDAAAMAFYRGKAPKILTKATTI